MTRPDVIAAVITRLLADSSISSLLGTRVSSRLQDSWNMPTSAVILRAAGGPVGTPESHFMFTRIDVFFYGETDVDAALVWRTVDPVLCPGQESMSSFKTNECIVYSISPERGHSSEVEPDSGWPRVSCSYIISWAGVPS